MRTPWRHARRSWPTLPAPGASAARVAEVARLRGPNSGEFGYIAPGPNSRGFGYAARGFTLVELLITIAVIGVLAAIIIPQLTSDLPDRLGAGAQVVASDIDYARALAVAHGSNYRITFDPAGNAYWLEHTGSNSLFHVLPPSPFRTGGDPPNRQTTRLAELPIPRPGVRLIGAVRISPSVQPATDVEFKPLGDTTSPATTVVWLACGEGLSNRFVSVSVDPVTGLTEIGPVQAALPSAVAALLQ